MQERQLSLLLYVVISPEVHSFMEMDHEIFSRGHSLPSADSRRAVFSFWQKNVHNTG